MQGNLFIKPFLVANTYFDLVVSNILICGVIFHTKKYLKVRIFLPSFTHKFSIGCVLINSVNLLKSRNIETVEVTAPDKISAHPSSLRIYPDSGVTIYLSGLKHLAHGPLSMELCPLKEIHAHSQRICQSHSR